MLKTKSSRADFFHKDQKRVLILNGPPPLPRHPFQFSRHFPFQFSRHCARSGFVLCYYEPLKHTDYPDKTAKGYLPLWMLSKLEADVSLAVPQFSLHYGSDVFTFKGAHQTGGENMPADVYQRALLQPASASQTPRAFSSRFVTALVMFLS